MDLKLKEVMESAIAKEKSSSSGPSSRRIGGGVTGAGSSTLSSGPSAKRTMSNVSQTIAEVDEEIPEQKSAPVTRRKRVVKKDVVPEEIEDEEPEESGPRYQTRDGPSVSDDEEFSDFSF